MRPWFPVPGLSRVSSADSRGAPVVPLGAPDWRGFVFKRACRPLVSSARVAAKQFVQAEPASRLRLELLLLQTTPLAIALAWIFVAGRVLHSVVQILTRNVRLRGIVFTVNFLAVLGLWVLVVVAAGSSPVA